MPADYKILLLSDTPPRKDASGSLVLDQLCRFLPRDALACYLVLNWYAESSLSGDLDWIPTRHCKKPIDYYGKASPPLLGQCASFVMERVHELFHEKRIARDIIAFAREQGVTHLWCVLEGQSVIRLARPVARALGVPLHTLVWDPPEWGLRNSRVNRSSTRSILGEYAAVLSASRSCATASWVMAEEYRSRYGVATLPVIASLPRELALAPAREIHPGDTLLIGMAGQLYSAKEWNLLLETLDSAGWQIAGRRVKIRLLGKHDAVAAAGHPHIECLGWRGQQETIEELSRCDLLYCPYWFDAEFAAEARLCFPSKLTTYLATGRPALFHGPDYASPALFLKEHAAGMLCCSLDRGELLGALESLVRDRELYRETAANAHRAFLEHFTLDIMQRDFYRFLELPEG